MNLDAIAHRAHNVATLVRSGVLAPGRPDRLAHMARALYRWGVTPAAGYQVAAARYPDEPAIVDELGALTFGEVQRRTNAMAHALADRGVNESDNVALLIRNHRGYVEATVACSKLGAHVLYLNTGFAAPQIADVVAREKPTALIYDEEFSELVGAAGRGRKRFLAWQDSDRPVDPTLEQLATEGDPSEPVAPSDPGRVVILTSGTTGKPKGAARAQPASLDPVGVFLSKIPYRARERMLIAAPLFHSWGFLHFTIGMPLCATLVLQRRFTPEQTLSAMAAHRTTALAVVPVMLKRILELGPEIADRYDTRATRIIAASGSTLPGDLALEVMDRFGDVLYNLYGSTEVAWASIATPQDLRAAPGTAGRPPRGTVVRLLDDHGHEVPRGETGRVFVGNAIQFEGYTGGGGKDVVGGLMSSGDVGHFDAGGRLFIDGRDDEMIVSGGENVFPREVEDLLYQLEAVADLAVVGVPDGEFGQRLKTVVVREAGHALSADDVRAHVKAHLARYKVPRDVEFRDQLPRNATGKVLKREL